MKTLLIFTTFIIFNTSLIAQNSETYTGADFILEGVNNVTLKYEPKTVKGTPYANENFLLSLISPINKKFAVRYNAVDDQMEVMKNDESIITLSKTKNNYTINLDNKNYRLFKNGDDYNYFVVVFENTNLTLLKKESKQFTEEKEAASSYSQDQPAEFDKNITNTFHVIYKDSIIKLSNKKSFLDMFPDKTDVLKKYLKKNKINFKDQKDLVKLISYTNTLF